MYEGFTARVKARLAELGRTQRAASLKVSTNPDLFRSVLRQGDEANPTAETLARMAEALEMPLAELQAATGLSELGGPVGDAAPPHGRSRPSVLRANLTPPLREQMARDIPVLGTVAGSELGKGAFQMSPDVVDYVGRPQGLATAKDVYALYVEGESMVPRFEPGDLVFVHPHRKPRIGDYVVVQEPDSDNGEARAFIKKLVAITTRLVRTRQFNPDANIDFVIRPGLLVHRVMTDNELYGI